MSRELRPAPVARCLLVWSGSAVALGALGCWLLPDLAAARATLASAGLAGRSFDEVLVWLCEAALLVLAAWLWVVTGVVAGDAARGRDGHRRGVPHRVRRLVLAACGAALVGGLATPSYAGPADADRERPTVAGLPLPDRATVTMHVSRLMARETRAAGRARPASPPAPHTVVVRPGDTLWSLAGQTLAPGAPDAAIAQRWQRIYAVNRSVIGADPDLLQPDQRLRLPHR